MVEGTGYGFITEKLELGLRIFARGITTIVGGLENIKQHCTQLGKESKGIA
jgi:hypothetical protein